MTDTYLLIYPTGHLNRVRVAARAIEALQSLLMGGVSVVCPVACKRPVGDPDGMAATYQGLIVPDLSEPVRGAPAQPKWIHGDRCLDIIRAFEGAGRPVVWMLPGIVPDALQTDFEDRGQPG